MKLRPFSGSSVTCFSVMTWPTLALSVSSVDGIGFHFDRLADVAGLQLQVDALDLIDVQLHVGPHGDLEAGLLRRDEVDADRKQRHRERALIVGVRLARQPCLLVGDRDLDLRHHRTARILTTPVICPVAVWARALPAIPSTTTSATMTPNCCSHGESPLACASRSGRRATSRARYCLPRTAPSRRNGASTLPIRAASNDRKWVRRSVGSRLMDGNNNRDRRARSAQRNVRTRLRTSGNRLACAYLRVVLRTLRSAGVGCRSDRCCAAGNVAVVDSWTGTLIRRLFSLAAGTPEGCSRTDEEEATVDLVRLLLSLSLAHRHRRQCRTEDRSSRSPNSPFHYWLLA